MPILKAGVLYFALAFGAGFVLGSIRVLWAVPIFGARTAELMETPIMFVVIALAARWTVRYLAVPPTPYRKRPQTSDLRIADCGFFGLMSDV
jgi:hypothetical protein